jgi:hypothetical protein
MLQKEKRKKDKNEYRNVNHLQFFPKIRNYFSFSLKNYYSISSSSSYSSLTPLLFLSSSSLPSLLPGRLSCCGEWNSWERNRRVGGIHCGKTKENQKKGDLGKGGTQYS